jgi:hypothetical protein
MRIVGVIEPVGTSFQSAIADRKESEPKIRRPMVRMPECLVRIARFLSVPIAVPLESGKAVLGGNPTLKPGFQLEA